MLPRLYQKILKIAHVDGGNAYIASGVLDVKVGDVVAAVGGAAVELATTAQLCHRLQLTDRKMVELKLYRLEPRPPWAGYDKSARNPLHGRVYHRYGSNLALGLGSVV